MSTDLELRMIDGANWRVCVGLRVKPSQADLICSNAESLAEAGVTRNAESLGIYIGESMVGLVVIVGDDPVEIHRFMVDGGWQGRGIGKRALQKILTHIAEKHPESNVLIKFLHWNRVAERLYLSVGFCDTRERDGDEKVYHLSKAMPEAET